MGQIKNIKLHIVTDIKMKLILYIAVLCTFCTRESRCTITKEELAQNQVTKEYHLKFVGFGLSNASNRQDLSIQWDVTWEECLQSCLEKRENEGTEWNGLEYIWSQNICWCQKDDVGAHEEDRTKDLFHFRFQ